MTMEIRIRLPGMSAAVDQDLAARAMPLAIAHRHGPATAGAAPAGTANPCEDHGCEFVGEFVDNLGRKWLLYDCGGTYEMYLA
jgi:hypothetical protein